MKVDLIDPIIEMGSKNEYGSLQTASIRGEMTIDSSDIEYRESNNQCSYSGDMYVFSNVGNELDKINTQIKYLKDTIETLLSKEKMTLSIRLENPEIDKLFIEAEVAARLVREDEQ